MHFYSDGHALNIKSFPIEILLDNINIKLKAFESIEMQRIINIFMFL